MSLRRFQAVGPPTVTCGPRILALVVEAHDGSPGSAGDHVGAQHAMHESKRDVVQPLGGRGTA
jgi:hypothetical protein